MEEVRRYAEMKDSGVKWIGTVPAQWSLAALKYVCSMQAGKNLTSEQISDSGGYPVYGGNGLRGYFEDYNSDGNYLLIGRQGALCGNVHRVSGKFWATEHAVITNNKLCEDVNFLYYLLISMDLNQYSSASAAQPGLSVGIISNIKTPFPKISVQKLIASYLDDKCSSIDDIIASARASIADYKHLKASTIYEAVTKGLNPDVEMKESGFKWIGEIPELWSVSALKFLLDILPGYAFSSSDFDTMSGIRLLRGINVSPSGVRWNETVYWNYPLTDELKRFLLQEGDVVLGLDRPWITDGTRICTIQADDTPSLLLQRVCRIRPKANCDIRFVTYWLKSDMFYSALAAETTGISVPHISTEQIAGFRIAMPHLAEQQAIAAYLDTRCAEIDSLIAEKEALIADLEAYKKSLIYECVTGKRRVA